MSHPSLEIEKPKKKSRHKGKAEMSSDKRSGPSLLPIQYDLSSICFMLQNICNQVENTQNCGTHFPCFTSDIFLQIQIVNLLSAYLPKNVQVKLHDLSEALNVHVATTQTFSSFLSPSS